MIAEWSAVKVLLEGTGATVRDSAVDKDGEEVRGTYLMLFPAGPESLNDGRWASIPRPDSDAEYSLPVRAISTDADGVRLLADRVMQLVGLKPAVNGRRADPLTVEFDPLKVDNAVSPPLFFMDMWVEFTSRRA